MPIIQHHAVAGAGGRPYEPEILGGVGYAVDEQFVTMQLDLSSVPNAEAGDYLYVWYMGEGHAIQGGTVGPLTLLVGSTAAGDGTLWQPSYITFQQQIYFRRLTQSDLNKTVTFDSGLAGGEWTFQNIALAVVVRSAVVRQTPVVNGVWAAGSGTSLWDNLDSRSPTSLDVIEPDDRALVFYVTEEVANSPNYPTIVQQTVDFSSDFTPASNYTVVAYLLDPSLEPTIGDYTGFEVNFIFLDEAATLGLVLNRP